MNESTIAGIALGATLVLGAAVSVPAADGTESMRLGKATFQTSCGSCHSLKDALTVTMSKAEWTSTVKRMITQGAELDGQERNNVINYLSARSTFSNFCSTCHDLGKVVDDKERNWNLTIDQMGAHFKDLSAKGMTKGKSMISESDKKDIAALLTVLLDKKK